MGVPSGSYHCEAGDQHAKRRIEGEARRIRIKNGETGA